MKDSGNNRVGYSMNIEKNKKNFDSIVRTIKIKKKLRQRDEYN